LFMKQREQGFLTITDPQMTRFNITLDEGIDLVLWALENSLGGEIFVPKIPSYQILDVARAIAPECELRITGIRPGEKLHEEMITSSDSLNTVDLGPLYAILPKSSRYTFESYCESREAKSVPKGFKYSSGDNPHILTVDELSIMIANMQSPKS